MINIVRKALIQLKIFFLRRKGIHLNYPCTIAPNVYLFRNLHGNNLGNITIDQNCELCQGVVIKTYGGEIKINKNVYIGEYVIMYGHGGITIGENTLIAMHTCIVSSNHTIPPRGNHIRSTPDILLPVKIGSDVWIGANCSILGGITVGNGVVIGAGSVVNRDIPPYAIAVGNPAKIIKYRE